MATSLPKMDALHDRIMYALDRARKSHQGITNVEIAKTCGLTRATITQWQDRVIADPKKFSAQACLGLAALSGLPAEWIALGHSEISATAPPQKPRYRLAIIQLVQSIERAPRQTRNLLKAIKATLPETAAVPTVVKQTQQRIRRTSEESPKKRRN